MVGNTFCPFKGLHQTKIMFILMELDIFSGHCFQHPAETVCFILFLNHSLKIAFKRKSDCRHWVLTSVYTRSIPDISHFNP